MSSLPITVSLVVYRTSIQDLQPIFSSIASFCCPDAICIVDNGADEALRRTVEKNGWHYVRPQTGNVGYGAGHNLGFKQLTSLNKPYHLVINPDIEADAEQVQILLSYADQHPDIGLLMPDIRYADGSRQMLCKLLPSPMDLMVRRFLPDCAWKKSAQARYELHGWDHEDIREIPSLSGCFMLMRREAFLSVGGFDERFFLYLEDFDLCRKIGQKWKTVYCPSARVVHHHAKGSYKSKRLLSLHICSAIKYFNKWGWFFDAERSDKNKKCLNGLDF